MSLAIIAPIAAVNITLFLTRLYQNYRMHQRIIVEVIEVNRLVVSLESRILDRLSPHEEGAKVVSEVGTTDIMVHIKEGKELVKLLTDLYKDLEKQALEAGEDETKKAQIRDKILSKAKPSIRLNQLRVLKQKLCYDMLLLVYSLTNHVVGPDEETSWTDGDDEDLIDKLKSIKHDKKITRRLKTFHNCFTGKDAVSWMVENKRAFTRSSAVVALNNLLSLRAVIAISGSSTFKDSSDSYYQFSEDSEPEEDEEELTGGELSAAAVFNGPIVNSIKQHGSADAWFKYELAHSPFTVNVIVFFRGLWDATFCRRYLKRWELTREPLLSSNARIIAFTSDTQDQADKAKAKWGLSFPTIGDPSNSLAKHLEVHISKRKGFPNGMAQAGVFVSMGDLTIYRWTARPAVNNLGGGKARPDPFDIVKLISASTSGQVADTKVHLGCPLTTVGWDTEACPVT